MCDITEGTEGRRYSGYIYVTLQRAQRVEDTVVIYVTLQRVQRVEDTVVIYM